MTSKNSSSVPRPDSVAGTPNPEKHDQEVKETPVEESSTSPDPKPEPELEPEEDPTKDADSECSDTPEPTSGPCTCHCGRCCSHNADSTPQHCVRCHRDYVLNHSGACMVPHVFRSGDLDDSDEPRDVVVRSLCCGSNVRGGEPIKLDWHQPSPCFMGWHTTDVAAVEEMYNSVNVLRCNPGRGGKCLRRQMRHRAHYEHLLDDKVKYIKIDKEDKQNHLKRKREEGEEDAFEGLFEKNKKGRFGY